MSDLVQPREFRRGLLAHLANDVEAAEAAYRRALTNAALAPAARHHLIRLLEAESRWEEALEERRKGCDMRPGDMEGRQGLGMALLALGRYAEGWPLYEARKALPGVARFVPQVDYPEWDGRPVRSLTVWDEQGAGDTIQFSRFLPQLKASGAEVAFVCRPDLAPLMACLGADIIPADGKSKVPTAEAWIMLGSLPGLLGVTPQSLSAAPYLSAPRTVAEAWARRIDGGVHLGVMTAGNPRHPNDAHRSLPAEAGAFLLSLPGAVALSPELTPFRYADFADTAAVIERMSLVITVDTSIAHLAGALGRPCWVLLPHLGVDWRWMHDRSDSDWYASVRLYRQPAVGDWESVMRSVAADLPTFFQQAPS